jgi:AcrR family transcriptional regulator
MLKAVAQAGSSDTKSRIVEAALESLKEEGFAGTSARAIAKRGDFNQALIFYHFGTINDLLLAALDRTSKVRMARYGESIRDVSTVEEAVRVSTELYREDLASGHITVLSELIAGSLDRPDLAPEIVARMEPWIDLAEEVVVRVLGPVGITSVVPARTVAYAIVALYLGIDLLSHLERDTARAEALFDGAKGLANLARMIGAGGG